MSFPSSITTLLSHLHTASGDWSSSQKAKKAYMKLVEWLKDTTRSHTIDEEYLVVRELLSSHAFKWTVLQEAGIPLLPPMPNSPITLYDHELATYVDAYVANPMRAATDEESIQMFEYTKSHTSYPKISLPALRKAGMLKDE